MIGPSSCCKPSFLFLLPPISQWRGVCPLIELSTAFILESVSDTPWRREAVPRESILPPTAAEKWVKTFISEMKTSATQRENEVAKNAKTRKEKTKEVISHWKEYAEMRRNTPPSKGVTVPTGVLSIFGRSVRVTITNTH